jgi:hypothetical protein
LAALQPFDRHPADPGTLSTASSTLATQASGVLGLASSTRKTHAPVPAHWQGIGNDEAQQAARTVIAEAEQVSTAVAGTSVAMGYWSGEVRAFNTAVERITGVVNAAGTGAAAEGRTEAEIATLKQDARRQGETEWHRAYDEHIVRGGTHTVELIKKGPSDEELLRLFQAGRLPMSVVNLYPGVDFSKVDWHQLWANLRAQGIDPLSWATFGTFDPDQLKTRLDLFRKMGVPPAEFKNLLQLYWVAVAAKKAGIDLAQWDPNRGSAALKDIITSVYTYYGNLFLENPYMQWAGMANMIGPSFAAGFFDLDLMRKLAKALAGRPGVPVEMKWLANATDAELKYFETTFLSMQKKIFYDQAMMHEAYLGGGMDAIRELEAAGLIDSRTAGAWQQIDTGRRTGDNAMVSAGNTQLLRREQHDIIQDDYQKMYDRPLTGRAFTYLMTAVGEPSIPGAHSFSEYRPLWVSMETPGPERIPFTPFDNPLQGEIKVKTPLPDGNIALYEDRWAYISDDTLPAYQKLLAEDPELARRIVASDVEGRIEDYRIYHRVDDLIWQYTTDWRVDFDQ